MRRRSVLAGVGASLAGALAGCAGGVGGRGAPPAPATESGWVYSHAWGQVQTAPRTNVGGDEPGLFAWGDQDGDGTTVAALDAKGTERWTAAVSLLVGGLFPDANGVTITHDTASDDYAEGTTPQLGRLSLNGELLWTETLTTFDNHPQAAFRPAGEAMLVAHADGPTVAVDRTTGANL